MKKIIIHIILTNTYMSVDVSRWSNIVVTNLEHNFSGVCTLRIMPRSRSGPGNKSHQNKASRLRFAF